MKRRRYDDRWDSGYFPPKSTPLPADGIKARSSRGQRFVETWWADQWIAALQRIVDANRLQRGRSYARRGQVLSIEFKGNQVSAKVQGSRPTPYNVSIRVAAHSQDQWRTIIAAMASQAIFAAKLLAGEMPPDIESAFSSAGLHLYPAAKTDLITECSCPDWANPCKHVSAVYYLLGERFDSDPFLLFALRGKSKDEVIAELRAQRVATPVEGIDAETLEQAAQAGANPGPRTGEEKLPEGERESGEADSIEKHLDDFWVLSSPLPAASASGRPPVDAAVLKRLGPPEFWPNPDDFLKMMSLPYCGASIVAAAMLMSPKSAKSEES